MAGKIDVNGRQFQNKPFCDNGFEGTSDRCSMLLSGHCSQNHCFQDTCAIEAQQSCHNAAAPLEHSDDVTASW